MAGSTTKSVSRYNIGTSRNKYAQAVTIDFTADAADGSIPDTTFDVNGYLVQVTTNPGGTAPTDNWDIQVKDAEGGSLSGTSLDNRDTTNSETVVFSAPPLLYGTTTVTISGNSVNSATGRVVLLIQEDR